MDAARPEIEKELRNRIQSRKIEHEKQKRRQEREEKRRLRYTSYITILVVDILSEK